MSSYIIVSQDELYHHGVKGMHWGVRRYQNYDGTLTSKGKAKIASLEKKSAKVQKRIGGRDYQIKQIRSRKLDTNKAQKLAAKRTKLEAQKGKLAAKNQRAKNKVLTGQNISGRDRKRLAKEYKLDAKIGKIAKKQDPYKSKVQDLERRNSIDQKKLDKLAKKIDKIGTPNEKMMAKARKQIDQNREALYEVYIKHPNDYYKKNVDKQITKYEKKLERITGDTSQGTDVYWKFKQDTYKPLSKAEKQKKMQSAKKGMIDSDFVDITQNEKWSNKKEMSEYSNYLDNPYKYMRERNRKSEKTLIKDVKPSKAPSVLPNPKPGPKELRQIEEGKKLRQKGYPRK